VEYNISGSPYVTVLDATTKTDLMKALIGSGFFLVETRRDKRLQKLVAEYESAQQDALKNRYNMWEIIDFITFLSTTLKPRKEKNGFSRTKT
ncbi:hypothetical protein M8J75_004351, partial [Diaphorina citri]